MKVMSIFNVNKKSVVAILVFAPSLVFASKFVFAQSLSFEEQVAKLFRDAPKDIGGDPDGKFVGGRTACCSESLVPKFSCNS